MSDCSICKPDPLPAHRGLGVPVPLAGVRHRSDCPSLPHLSAEAKERLRVQLADIAAARRRAYVESQFYVIG
jgi:hypothetical protein